MQSGRKFAAVLCTALLATACSDAEKGISPAGPSAAALAQSEANEKATLTKLTHTVSVALDDAGLRNRVRNDLRESRHTVEHKLAFSEYLRGRTGAALLARMAEVSGLSTEQILAQVASVRPLEFYMPGKEHRASWRGGANLWVASYLEDDGSERPAVFDVKGRAVPLWNASAAPASPTMVLVPVETNFAQPLSTTKFKNKDDNGGQTIGTLQMEPIDDCVEPMGGTGQLDTSIECGGGGGGTYEPVVKPAGVWMSFAYGDAGVPDGTWGLKGEPEIEMHVFGVSPTDATKVVSLSCSDANASGYKRFDMNDHYWNGDVLIWSQTDINNYYARTTQDYTVQMWEDDDTGCQVKTDKDLTGFLKWLIGAYNSNAIKTDTTTSSGWRIDPGKVLDIIVGLASWLQSNDEFIGNAQDAPGQYTDATHRLERPGDSYNGRIKLFRR